MLKDIIIAVISAFFGGFIKLTLDKRKENVEKKKEHQQQLKFVFENRPELSIVEYKDYISRVGYGIKQKCDIEVFMTHIENVSISSGICALYKLEHFNQDDWCCVIYTLNNMGKTDIASVNLICTYKKDTVIFPCTMAKKYGEDGLLNYSECYDKKIRVGESITLKICYHKDRIITGMVSSIMELGLQDSNGSYWCQPFFAPYDKVYDSYRLNSKDYHARLNIDDAVKCFEKPWLW